MIDFRPVTIEEKPLYDRYLSESRNRSCEYAFANMYLWGQRYLAEYAGFLMLFSRFDGLDSYPFPMGTGDFRQALDAILEDAGERSIPCRITNLDGEGRQILETLYPGRFHIYDDRDFYDYVYAIDHLADLPGSKYHRKRNHLRNFEKLYPTYTTEPLGDGNLDKVRIMTDRWYETKRREASQEESGEDPAAAFQMERTALENGLKWYRELNMEGLVLLQDGEVLAMTMGSRIAADTFNVHFEKAAPGAEGAYVGINRAFADYIREKYPEVRYLNREDDMGIPGLR
ncbi:MAG: DUF2156 domain-containing protein, partial [Clostridia bacterium]|nr:DUF2156 domain-containing protein [Clostridia bacterium]